MEGFRSGINKWITDSKDISEYEGQLLDAEYEIDIACQELINESINLLLFQHHLHPLDDLECHSVGRIIDLCRPG
jgi:hypothetical protein